MKPTPLHRGGDRDADSSIHLIAVNRLRQHEPTQRYLARNPKGKTKKEVIRLLAVMSECGRTYHKQGAR